MSLKNRLVKLEGLAGVPEGGCPRPAVGLLLSRDEGGPLPAFDEADVEPCRRCGAGHVLWIVEEVVGVTAEGQS
jgi:hypothetical protein